MTYEYRFKPDNAPSFLREKRIWLCWQYQQIDGRMTKVPLSPLTGKRIDVTNSENLTDFETAVNAALQHGAGIGFGIVYGTRIVGIDIDDPVSKGKINGDAEAIYRMGRNLIADFNSYTELSPSGKGLHIIVIADLPPDGRRSSADCLEAYSANRFFTFTGEVLNNLFEVRECQEVAEVVFNALKKLDKHVDEIPQQPANKTPHELLAHIATWRNAAVFQEHAFKSQDEVKALGLGNEYDQTTFNFIVQAQKHFECVNFELACETFWMTERGKRDKAKRQDYLAATFVKSFDRMEFGSEQVSFTQMLNAGKIELDRKLSLERQIADYQEQPQAIPHVEPVLEKMGVYSRPPGLIGMIADFIYQAAFRPVPEIALAGALGLMAGLVGRAYNVEGQALNLYVMLLAKTGRGKEAMSSGINKIMSACALTPTPRITKGLNFHEIVGPQHIRSGVGLMKALKKRPCFVSILGEFAYELETMHSPRASTNQIEIKRALLDLYGKSGPGNVVKGSAYSDTEKNDDTQVESPSLSLLCESVPEEIYRLLDIRMIQSGLLGRFTFIEYKGFNKEINKMAGDVRPSRDLLQAVIHAAQCAQTITNNSTSHKIEMSDEADAMFAALQAKCDAIVESDVDTAGIWNRVSLKAKKLAGLVAVGIDAMHPLIDANAARWGIEIATTDAKNLEAKFNTGETGEVNHETEQVSAVRNKIREYLTKPFDKLLKFQGRNAEMQARHIIPKAYLQATLPNLAVFKNDKRGSTNALKIAIDVLLSNGELKMCDEATKKAFSTGAILYSFEGDEL